MANLVKPPAFQSYEYDPAFWSQFGGKPWLFMPMRAPGRNGGVNDDSGHSNNGTLNSGASWNPTPNGMWLNFHSSSNGQLFSPTLANNLGNPTPFSITFDIVLEDLTTARYILGKDDLNVANGWFVMLCGNSADARTGKSNWLGFSQEFSSGNSFGGMSTAFLSVGVPYRITINCPGGATPATCYANGEPYPQYVAVSGSGSQGSDASNTFRVGYAGGAMTVAGISLSPLPALIGSVLIGPYLTPSQIATLYRNPYGMFRAPPKRYSLSGFSSGNTYNQTGSGGALGGGTAVVNVIYSPTASGGALGGGADITSATYNPTASGGALGGGAAIIAAIYSVTATGGALGGGTAAANADYNPTASGGAVTNGTATFAYNETGTGGALGGGTAVVAAIYSITATGGALGDGSAVIDADYNPTTSSGALAGGGADANADYSITGHGGALGGGAAPTNAIYNQIGAGGSLGNSTADANVDYNPTASSGAVLDGSATFEEWDFLIASGGVLGGDNAVITSIYQATASGGFQCAGGDSNQATYSVTASGGALANGTADIFADYNLTTSGGTLSSGSASNATYDETGSGGAVADGIAGLNVYDEVMCGGVSVLGWSVQTFIPSNLGWKCVSSAKYIPGMYVKPQREKTRRRTLLAGITICNQGIYQKLLKEGDQLA